MTFSKWDECVWMCGQRKKLCMVCIISSGWKSHGITGNYEEECIATSTIPGVLFPLSNKAAYKPSGISNGCLHNWAGGSHARAFVWGVSEWRKEIHMHWINKPCVVDCARKRQAHLNIWFKDEGLAEDTILPIGWSQAQIWPHRWHFLWAKTGCFSVVK